MDAPAGGDFIRNRIRDDLAEGRVASVVTRFPPEPNGYLHIGHAKSICLNFGVAAEFGGHCNLRFDDTNPATEEQAYIDVIKEDVRWLGFEWGEPVHASDYFEHALRMGRAPRREDHAYVDEPERRRRSARVPRHTHRARPGEPLAGPSGRGEPRPAAPHARRRVRSGRLCAARAHRHGARATSTCATPCSTASSTMGAPYRTGDAWRIYPTYDFAHGQSDAIEGVTHSLCTLEFADHRPLYDWLLERVRRPRSPPEAVRVRPPQPEYTILSKRAADPAGRSGPRFRLGRPAHADPSRAAAPGRAGGGAPRLRLAAGRSPRAPAGSKWRCWTIASANSSTGPPSAAWPCCGRSRW